MRLLDYHLGGKMSLRVIPLPLIATLIAGPLPQATDPFAGKWKVNSAKSTLTDELTVEAAGANRYRLTFGPGQVDTIVADGIDHPALFGTTFSITVKGKDHWIVVRKINGRKLLSAEWTLSADGNTLNDVFTQYLPDGFALLGQPLPNGSTLFMPYVYQRTVAGSGFLGTWDSESATVSKGLRLEVQTLEGGGLSFKRSDEATTRMFTLDGKDYPDVDPSADSGAVYSGRRVNERTVEITYKLKSQTTNTRRAELSADLKTLTVTEQSVGQHKPKSVLVFDRQ